MTNIRDIRGGLSEAVHDAYRPRTYGSTADRGGPVQRVLTGTRRLLANLRDLAKVSRHT